MGDDFLQNLRVGELWRAAKLTNIEREPPLKHQWPETGSKQIELLKGRKRSEESLSP
jgi:hypothetical protein